MDTSNMQVAVIVPAGVDVVLVRPGQAMAGHRFDQIVSLSGRLPSDIGERAAYLRWIDDLRLKIRPGGKLHARDILG